MFPCQQEDKWAESDAAWVKETIAAEEWELIRKLLQRGQLTGSPRFVDEIEKKIERLVENRSVPFLFQTRSVSVTETHLLLEPMANLGHIAPSLDHLQGSQEARIFSYLPFCLTYIYKEKH